MTKLAHSYTALKMYENCPKRYYHQQQLLANAVGRIGELELVLFLGAHAEPSKKNYTTLDMII